MSAGYPAPQTNPAGMTVLQMLQLSYSNICFQLATATTNPKPFYDIDGQKIDWVSYQKMLMDGLEKIHEQIMKQDDALYEEWTQVYTAGAHGAYRAQFPMGHSPGGASGLT